MDDKIEELEKIILQLKKENLYLQNQLSKKNRDVSDDIKDLQKEMQNLNKISINIFKNNSNENDSNEDDTFFFIDILLCFYDEIIEYVNLGREYDEKNDKKNVEYMFYKIVECYKEHKDIMTYYICKKRIDYINEIIEFCQESKMSSINKIEYFYNKIYYNIFIEFLGNHSFSA